MKVIEEYPPNYINIVANLPAVKESRSIFSYGGFIYNPHKVVITPDLELHESVHAQQQAKDCDAWWNKYLLDSQFRLEQEIEAYGEQYKFFKQYSKSTKLNDWLRHKIAEALSSPVYGSIISYYQADTRIRHFAKSVA